MANRSENEQRRNHNFVYGANILSFAEKDFKYIRSGIKDVLNISVFAYNEKTDSYKLERLKLNEVTTLSSTGVKYNGRAITNINIYFDYEYELCEIVSDNKDIQLSVGKNASLWDDGVSENRDRLFGFEANISTKGYAAANPFGTIGDSNFAKHEEGLVYYLNFSHTPVGNIGLRSMPLTLTTCP